MMNARMSPVALAAVVLAFTAACVELDSTDVLTSGVSPDYTVTVDNTETTVTAQLHAGKDSLTYLDLQGSDELVAQVGDEEHKLNKETNVDFNAPTYSNTFANTAAGTVVNIAFHRSVDAGAKESTVSLPTTFAITTAGGAAYSRLSDALTITVDSAAGTNETMRATVAGDCINDSAIDFGASESSATFAPATLSAKTTNEGTETPNAECNITVTVTRSTIGTLDTAFEEGGTFVANRVQKIDVTSKP